MRDLQAAHAPVVEIELPEPSALGAEFVRWEIATAVAGALLGINPFDEPNVQQAKDATRVLLDGSRHEGRLPVARRDARCRRRRADAERGRATRARRRTAADAFLTLLRPGDYFALLAYLGPDPELAAELRALRDGGARSHARRDDVRLRPALSAFDRAAAQGRAEHRRVRADHRGAAARPRRFPGEPFSFGTLGAGAGARRFRVARRDRPPRAARAPAVARSAPLLERRWRDRC